MSSFKTTSKLNVPYILVDSYQNWDMLDEPFTQQAPLNTESTECEELSDKSSQPDPDQGLYSFENFHQVLFSTTT